MRRVNGTLGERVIFGERVHPKKYAVAELPALCVKQLMTAATDTLHPTFQPRPLPPQGIGDFALQ